MRSEVFVPASVPKSAEGEFQTLLGNRDAFCRLLRIKHKQQQKFVPFQPNDAQRRLWALLDRSNRVIVVKARQVGISTATRAWQFHRAYTSPHPQVFAVLSFHDRSAKRLRRMDRLWLRELPKILRRPLSLDSATDSEFEDTGAGVSSFTTEGRGGTRSFDFTGAHLSEFAFYSDPGEVLSQVMSTVGDGPIVIESTADVPGDKFDQLIQGAPHNGWSVFTYWWHEHEPYRAPAVPDDFERTEEEGELAGLYGLDDYQLQWRRVQLATLGPARFRREYPGCLSDAFASRGATWFRAEDLDRIATEWFDSSEFEFAAPVEGGEYVMGVDISGGIGQDFSAVTVLDVATRQPVYIERNNRLAPHAWAARCATIGHRYNHALMLVESNNHGHSFLREIQVLRYPHLWANRDGGWWVTSTQSKLDIYDGLREVIESGIIQQLDQATLGELRSLEVKKMTPQAPRGLHDDLAMSLALAYRCLRDASAMLRRKSAGNRVDKHKQQMRAERIRKQPLAWRTTK
ncbi:MAG: hypothetical protein GY872_04175 [Roseibacillus sp.]|nr:hypothetical protein [Roseibacillus sp.]